MSENLDLYLSLSLGYVAYVRRHNFYLTLYASSVAKNSGMVYMPLSTINSFWGQDYVFST